MKRLKSKSSNVVDDVQNTKSSDEVKEKPVEVTNWSRRFCIGISLLLFFGLFIIFIINANYTTDIIQQTSNIETDILVLLKRYDRNDDGLLDAQEFEPIALKLLSLKVCL